MARPLPTRVQDITAGWLSDALSVGVPGLVVTRAVFEDVMQGTATKVRVRVQFNEIGRAAGMPATIIVKGGFGAHREMMASIYELEMRFYRDLASRLTHSRAPMLVCRRRARGQPGHRHPRGPRCARSRMLPGANAPVL